MNTIPNVNVVLNENKTEATVSITFPLLIQADAFASICRSILENMKPIVEGEDMK